MDSHEEMMRKEAEEGRNPIKSGQKDLSENIAADARNKKIAQDMLSKQVLEIRDPESTGSAKKTRSKP